MPTDPRIGAESVCQLLTTTEGHTSEHRAGDGIDSDLREGGRGTLRVSWYRCGIAAGIVRVGVGRDSRSLLHRVRGRWAQGMVGGRA
jgi:hypothetical protein